jgi:hypothetical protein
MESKYDTMSEWKWILKEIHEYTLSLFRRRNHEVRLFVMDQPDVTIAAGVRVRENKFPVLLSL